MTTTQSTIAKHLYKYRNHNARSMIVNVHVIKLMQNSSKRL